MTAVVLAAGSSRRLGQPKQLLPYRGRTLLDATLDQVRAAGVDQLLLTLGGAADDVEASVDLTGVQVVRNASYPSGCSSSIAAALPSVDSRATGIVLLLGDQPGVGIDAIQAVVAAGRQAAIVVGRYADGPGHPFWLSRTMFGDLAQLHGDKGVWRLIDARPELVTHVPLPGRVPLDVDTREAYDALLAADRAGIPVQAAR